MEWLTKAGLSPLEALQTATINPARFLRRDAWQGTVRVGKRADLLVLDADPLVDIRNTTGIAAVIIRGKLMTKPALDAIVASHYRARSQPLARPRRPSPRQVAHKTTT